MGADIRLIDEKGNDITDSTINFGKARLGFPTTQKIKILNQGDKIAYNLKFSSESNDSLIANDWKFFQMYENSEQTQEISLGDLGPGKYLEGMQEKSVEFIQNGILSEKWNTGEILYDAKNLKFIKNTGDGSGISAARLEWNLDNVKNFEMEFKIKLEADLSYDNFDTAILNFPLRMNSRKDQRGYCFSFQKRRKDGKIYSAIYKGGKGMVENLDRDYGTNIYNTGWIDFNEEHKIKFKLYNNVYDQPCFELYINNQPVLFKSSENPKHTTYLVIDQDEKSAYVSGGKLFLDYSIWNGDISLELTDVKIAQDIQEHAIMFQTVLGNEAVNNEVYSGYINMSYEEEI